MPRNPSEIERLTEERKELILEIRKQTLPKKYKEYLLRDLHAIEKQLGLDLYDYNGENK